MLPATPCFQGGTTPIVDLTTPDPNYTWNDPHVIKVGAQYWMYASATDNFVFPVKLYRLVSSDGVTWVRNPSTPILQVSAGQWDSGGVETPAVVFFNSQYHLFYTGYTDLNDVTTYRVGHAVSDDGVTFTKDAANPIVVPSGAADFRQLLVGEPGPVVFNGTLMLYFTAVGYNADVGAGLQTIGVTTTTDASTWTTPVRALAPDQAQFPLAANWAGFSTPNAIVMDGAVHLYVDVANNLGGSTWTQMLLHHARSADGFTGWVQDATPIRRREDYAWTAREIRSPDALLDGNVLRLYFAGDNYGTTPLQFGIGLLTCNVGS